jgi:ribosomal protein S18 acetylase RimI-like enzyme
MTFNTIPASDYSLPDLVTFLNQGFEDYFVPIEFNATTFLNMLRKDGVDLTTSRVLVDDDQPRGIALIARRGWVSRVAAMGIAKEARGKGAGSWFMDELIKAACERGEREMVLEVIEQNEPAVKLYRKAGFETIRRLVGFVRKDAEESQKVDLQEIDLRDVSRRIAQFGLADLPWQLSAECIAQMNPPARAYRHEQAVVALSNPEAEHVVVWSLLVEPEARGRGRGTEMLRKVISNHSGKTWHVPAVLPEELGKVFERARFVREELSQWQMKLTLPPPS